MTKAGRNQRAKKPTQWPRKVEIKGQRSPLNDPRRSNTRGEEAPSMAEEGRNQGAQEPILNGRRRSRKCLRPTDALSNEELRLRQGTHLMESWLEEKYLDEFSRHTF